MKAIHEPHLPIIKKTCQGAPTISIGSVGLFNDFIGISSGEKPQDSPRHD